MKVENNPKIIVQMKEENDFVGECEPSPEYKDDEILLKPVILQTW